MPGSNNSSDDEILLQIRKLYSNLLRNFEIDEKVIFRFKLKSL